MAIYNDIINKIKQWYNTITKIPWEIGKWIDDMLYSGQNKMKAQTKAIKNQPAKPVAPKKIKNIPTTTAEKNRRILEKMKKTVKWPIYEV